MHDYAVTHSPEAAHLTHAPHTQHPPNHPTTAHFTAHTTQLGLSNGLVPSRRNGNGKRTIDEDGEDEALMFPPVELSEYEKQVCITYSRSSIVRVHLSLAPTSAVVVVIAIRERAGRGEGSHHE